MAMNEEQQLILEKVRADFPSLTGEQALKLTAIMSHEGGLKGKPEYFQYRSPKALKNLTASFSGKASVKRRFEKAKADAIAQNKIIRAQNEKIERKSDKLKEVPVPSSSKQWLLDWNADLQKRYKDKTITADQYRKEFFDTVYEDIGGADYAGIGSIQVTGKQNLFDALRTQGEVGAQYLKILNDDPSAINSLKQNKDFLDVVTKGWIQKDLINTKKIDKPIETVIDTVNAGEVKANKIKKAETYNSILKDYNTPAPKTSDQQIPYPVTPEAGKFDSMKDLLRSIGEKVTSVIPSAQAAEFEFNPERDPNSQMYSLNPEADPLYKYSRPSSASAIGMLGNLYTDKVRSDRLDAMGEVISPPLAEIPQRYSFEEQQAMSDLMSGVGADYTPTPIRGNIPKIAYNAPSNDSPPKVNYQVTPSKENYMTMEELLMDKGLMKNPLLFDDATAELMWRQF